MRDRINAVRLCGHHEGRPAPGRRRLPSGSRGVASRPPPRQWRCVDDGWGGREGWPSNPRGAAISQCCWNVVDRGRDAARAHRPHGDPAQRGRVLAVGGLGKKLQPLSSVEIYDPVRDRWASTVPLPDVRFSHSATLLPDGRVLVVGGIVHGAISRSVLIFDPRKPAWRAGPPTLSPHAQQNALALPDGRILIAGGYGGRAEVYDPRAGRWTEVGGPARTRPSDSCLPAQWACPARHGCR